jgi:hypothetical protein
MSAGGAISEFDHALHAEETRRLRLRFLWYCGISVVVKVVLMWPELAKAFDRGNDGVIARRSVPVDVLGIAAFLWAIQFVKRQRVKRDLLARLALALVIGVAGSGLIVSRINMRHFTDPAREAILESERQTSSAQPTTASLHQEAVVEKALRWLFQSGTFWAFYSIIPIFIVHLLASALIPWTLRESLLAAAGLITIQTLVLLADVLFRGESALLLIVVAAAGMVILPGLAICWWRASRFRKSFRLNFEAKGFRKLTDELEYARQVHESCLSPQVTSGPLRLHYAYEPMRQIGGDFLFAHHPAGSQQMWLVLLDVTGHGIAAALTVNRLMVELQRQFLERSSVAPGDVLRSLNDYIAAHLARLGVFATAICVHVDGKANMLRWSSAGHPTGFICRGNGSIDALESTTMMLGISPWTDEDAATSETAFNDGDTLICFTDGATEAASESGIMLRLTGVKQILESIVRARTSPKDWPAAMLQRVREYRQAPPNDDLLVAALFAGE